LDFWVQPLRKTLGQQALMVEIFQAAQRPASAREVMVD
jgi:hypothetical protein